jgi:hypothetical protein
MDPFEGMTINPYFDQQQRELEIMRRQEMERSVRRRNFPDPYTTDPYYQSQGMIGDYSREYYGMQHQRGLIVCPVCGEHQCGWWENQILRNNAGEILKDMLNGVFQDEQYYERSGPRNYDEQEAYYQRMRERFYRPQPPKPEPVVRTEDTAYDVVSTEIKGKPKKQIPYPDFFRKNK